MDAWLRQHLGLSADDAGLILALVTVVIGFAGFVWRHRRSLRRLSSGDRRRYTTWFLKTYSTARNIYLDRDETLHLSAIYVSLSFQRRAEVREAMVGTTTEQTEPAAIVLADQTITRIIITGDPGTGKSTLLKAYGTAIMRPPRDRGGADLKLIGRSQEMPFFVPLRFLARSLDRHPKALARYIERELQDAAKIPDGRAFLRKALVADQCLILLDGLDEIPDSQYHAVQEAIAEFAEDNSAALPTHRARLVMTCRRQNFKRRQVDWIPTFASEACALAPLTDSEVFAFVRHREPDFARANAAAQGRSAAPRTPKDFFDAAMASDTAELHRIPLVLTMSVGLYLNRPAYQIPRSVGEFYRTVISHLVRRHDFPGATGRTNRYEAEDKDRYLREFAVAMASRNDRFGDFDFNEMLNFAERLTRRMARVPDGEAKAFVNELLDNSGLFTSVSPTEYAFSHLSIQEYLVAEQLSRDPRPGADFLLDRADDTDWRQVILFFAAFDHDRAESFVEALGHRSLELAANCLAGALVSDEVAFPILDGLLVSLERTVTADLVSALVAAVRAPRPSVRLRAAHNVSAGLSSALVQENLNALIADDGDGVLRLIHALATTNTPPVSAQVSLLASLVAADDRRLVGPLWSALATPGLADEEPDATRAIVGRLLRLAMDADCLAELRGQPPHRPSFVTDPVAGPALLRKAFPFTTGDASTNLVTLLAWADTFDVVPNPANRYFEAKAAGRLQRVEQDRRWTLSWAPFMLVRVLCYAGFVAAVIAALINVIMDWRVLTRPVGWWSLLLIAVPGAIAIGFALILSTATFDNERWSFLALGFDDGDPIDPRHRVPNNVLNAFEWTDILGYGVDEDGQVWWDEDTLRAGIGGFILGLPYAIAFAPLLGASIISIVVYLVVATLAVWLGFWLPATRVFNRERRFYLRKPNPYVDLYDDPKSRLWIGNDRRAV